MEFETIQLLILILFVASSFACWYYNEMQKADRENKELQYKIKSKDDELSYHKSINEERKKEIEEGAERLSNAMKESMYGVPKMKNPPLPPTKKDKKFKKTKTVNRNIIDPTTGDRLPIVRCHCGTTYNE
ncbi:hypothetical protein WAF17_16555 [Bernardetia sp. ABR2-2B]|uniref:hypothetical protein n=1 Tax=Bernardetia sp. ABR2-2B TaxID=3127472 RepID=UPI0030CEE958